MSSLLLLGLANRIADRANRQEQRSRGGTSIRPTLDGFHCDKSVLRVKGLGIRLGIDDHSDASVFIRHPERQSQYEPKKLESEALTLSRLIYREPGEPKDRQGIAWELSLRRERQIIDLDVRGGDGGISKDTLVVDGDVRDTEVVAELVLSRELVKKAIEIEVARAKRGSIVALAKRSDLNHAAGGAGPVRTSLSPAALESPDRTSA